MTLLLRFLFTANWSNAGTEFWMHGHYFFSFSAFYIIKAEDKTKRYFKIF